VIYGLHPDSPNPLNGDAEHDPSAHLNGVLILHPFLRLHSSQLVLHVWSGQVTYPFSQTTGIALHYLTSDTHYLSIH